MTAAELAQALGGVRSGRQWKCKCVAHEDSSPSLIVFDGRESVQVRCLAGCEQVDLINALRQRGLWEGRASNTDKGGQILTALKVSCETDAQRQRDRARRIFDDAMLCHGTIAQKYLEAREIWSVAKEIDHTVRFHPACPREKRVQPAIVVRMCSLGRPGMQAVQRIFLTDDARKDGTMMLGPVGKASMMVGSDGDDDNDWRQLNVAEGFESALSVRSMDPYSTWALGSAGALSRLDVLGGIDRLVIWADHDAAGLKAAHACMVRWKAAGVPVLTRVPTTEGWDPADVWRDRCARQ
jgi:putative DNA primase/helicase